MGFCTEQQVKDFLAVVPDIEKLIVASGIILLKYWLEVSEEEQTRRLEGVSTTAARPGSSRRWTSIVQPVVRLLAGPGRDVRGDRTS